MTRRDFLRVGALSAGFGLPELLRAESARAAGGSAARPRAKNVLLIYLGGGLTHLDTFDPKPEAPLGIRGKYGTIPARLAGVRYSDRMPGLAACSDLYALCRSQVTGSDHHETAAQWMLTGRYGAMQGGDHPGIGAVVAHELAPLNSLPAYVAIPRSPAISWELGGAAWLGEPCEAFKTGDPSQPGWKLPDLALQPEVSANRTGRRRELLDAVDGLARRVESSAGLQSWDSFTQRAAERVLSQEARNAFDLSRESERTREAYGKTGRWGMQALLARRLVEANVRFVLLQFGGWDHHARLFEEGDRMLRPFDQALAALLQDLQQRGLLEETQVAMYGDFGRTPAINEDGGRDHWGHAGSMLFAGAGVRGGQVIGKTDARGEYVVDRPIRPPEVAATLYAALGIDSRRELGTPDGGSARILPEAEPIHELFG